LPELSELGAMRVAAEHNNLPFERVSVATARKGKAKIDRRNP
jgi:hypothetical protein